MPFSNAAPRQLRHTRHVQCEGYLREDGLWDIEGTMTDTKALPMPLSEHEGGVLPAGKPLHHMGLRLTIDEQMKIHDAEAFMDYTPYRMCPQITEQFKKLIGLTIEHGFTRKTRELFGGINGCTHLLELLGPIATTAFQTTFRTRLETENWAAKGGDLPMINTCHSFAEDSQVIKDHWPVFYRSKA